MPKQTANLTVVAEEAAGPDQAVAAVQAEIQAQERRLVCLKARLAWEQGHAEREAAKARRA